MLRKETWHSQNKFKREERTWLRAEVSEKALALAWMGKNYGEQICLQGFLMSSFGKWASFLILKDDCWWILFGSLMLLWKWTLLGEVQKKNEEAVTIWVLEIYTQSLTSLKKLHKDIHFLGEWLTTAHQPAILKGLGQGSWFWLSPSAPVQGIFLPFEAIWFFPPMLLSLVCNTIVSYKT